MKVARINKPVSESATAIVNQAGADWKSSARLLEVAGDNNKAIAIYKTVLAKHPFNAYLYDRLMILYRKEKMYQKELALINEAIKNFTGLLHPRKNDHSKKVANLSKSILQAVGLSDKRGQLLYQPQPIARWEKRKKTVVKKVN